MNDAKSPSLPSAEIFLPDKGIWHVLHTKSRQEKALSEELARLGVLHFLPVITQKKFYGKRRFVVSEPLFPGYVFLRGSKDEAYAADRTRRVANIIAVPDQVQLQWELKNLAQALAQGVVLNPYSALKVGVRVRVTAGPLEGLEGLIEDRRAPDRLILQVKILGQAVSVDIDAALLEVID
jgi:transcription antitermination factor NusG